jgi:hypothetical protein
VIPAERGRAKRLTDWLRAHDVEPAAVTAARQEMDSHIAAAPVIPSQTDLVRLAVDITPAGQKRLRDAAMDAVTHQLRAQAHNSAAEDLALAVIGAVHRNADAIIAGLQPEFDELVGKLTTLASIENRTVESLVGAGDFEQAQIVAGGAALTAAYDDIVRFAARHLWEAERLGADVFLYREGDRNGLDILAAIRAGLTPWLANDTELRQAAGQLVDRQNADDMSQRPRVQPM